MTGGDAVPEGVGFVGLAHPSIRDAGATCFRVHLSEGRGTPASSAGNLAALPTAMHGATGADHPERGQETDHARSPYVVLWKVLEKVPYLHKKFECAAGLKQFPGGFACFTVQVPPSKGPNPPKVRQESPASSAAASYDCGEDVTATWDGRAKSEGPGSLRTPYCKI